MEGYQQHITRALLYIEGDIIRLKNVFAEKQRRAKARRPGIAQCKSSESLQLTMDSLASLASERLKILGRVKVVLTDSNCHST